MSSDSLSLTSLRGEREELRKDLIAWTRAYDIICGRVRESSEAAPRTPPLHQWSGSRAVLGSFELSMHAIERTIDEYGILINKIENGEIPNSDAPTTTLSLVKD